MASHKARRPFVVCDYGAADGGTSMSIMHSIVSEYATVMANIFCKHKIKYKYVLWHFTGHLKKEDSDREICVIYNDLPTSDFKTLFLRINGISFLSRV